MLADNAGALLSHRPVYGLLSPGVPHPLALIVQGETHHPSNLQSSFKLASQLFKSM